MRIAVLFIISIACGAANAGCGDRPVLTVQKEDGTTVGVVITTEQQDKTQKWVPGSGDPPLSLSKAIEVALSWAKTNYKRYDGVQLQSINLNSLGCSQTRDKWYYIVHFSPVIDGSALYGSGYFAAVLMDGTVIGPTPVKRDF